MTVAPASPSAAAMPRPAPLVAPATTATRPRNDDGSGAQFVTAVLQSPCKAIVGLTDSARLTNEAGNVKHAVSKSTPPHSSLGIALRLRCRNADGPHCGPGTPVDSINRHGRGAGTASLDSDPYLQRTGKRSDPDRQAVRGPTRSSVDVRDHRGRRWQ